KHFNKMFHTILNISFSVNVKETSTSGGILIFSYIVLFPTVLYRIQKGGENETYTRYVCDWICDCFDKRRPTRIIFPIMYRTRNTCLGYYKNICYQMQRECQII